MRISRERATALGVDLPAGKIPRKHPYYTHGPRRMNNTEYRYERRLKVLQAAGSVKTWEYEPASFKIGPSMRYTPDFRVVMADGSIEWHEIKGARGFTEAALLRLKVASERYPEWKWSAYQWKNREWRKVF